MVVLPKDKSSFNMKKRLEEVVLLDPRLEFVLEMGGKNRERFKSQFRASSLAFRHNFCREH
jgi:hypothetical protein